jgi:hypothetical protein
MSNFFLGLVGAAIGSVVGMPALGFAVGAGLGGALHHASAHSQAPRLNDLTLQTSAYGLAIPRVYGTYRLAGNVIWATDILEEGDAKRGYRYYGNFALGLCQGPMLGIRTVWADGKIILKPPEDTPDSLLGPYPPWLRFYPGDEAQLPDPLLQAHQKDMPGFRGLAYVVFDHFPLANFNNRLPNIEVEVVQKGGEVLLSVPDIPAAPLRPGVSRAGQQRVIKEPPVKKNVAVPVPLADIVADLCLRAGLPDNTVDTSLLTASVQGFILAEPTSAREATLLLQQAYFFDVVGTGVQLTCVPRGHAIPHVIPSSALGAVEEGQSPQPMQTTRLQTLDLPQSVTVFFSDRAAHYDVATQRAQRQTTQATVTSRVELPLVLTPVEAAHIAEVLLSEAWAARAQYAFSLSRAYSFLEPSDVLMIENKRMRITHIEYGGPGLLKIKAIAEELHLYIT